LTAGLKKQVPQKDIDAILVAWRDNDPMKAWQAVTLQSTAAELEAAEATFRIDIDNEANHPAMHSNTVVIGVVSAWVTRNRYLYLLLYS
jgi:hypothetical protein